MHPILRSGDNPLSHPPASRPTEALWRRRVKARICGEWHCAGPFGSSVPSPGREVAGVDFGETKNQLDLRGCALCNQAVASASVCALRLRGRIDVRDAHNALEETW